MPKPLTQTTGRRKAAVARVRLRPHQAAAVESPAPLDPGAAAGAPPAAAPPAAAPADGAPAPEASAAGTTEAGATESGSVETPARDAGAGEASAPSEGGADPTAGGRITINGRPIERYFPSATQRMVVTEPLRLTDTVGRYSVDASIDGGGVTGQAGALRLGIARALAELEPDLRIPLKRAGLLTRDAREKESKKYGLKKARKAPQYSKR